MRPGILGTKIGMTRVMDERGTVDCVTVVKAGPCVVMQVKTKENDGYDAVQLGFTDCKPHRSTLPLIGHASKAGTGPKRYLREIKLDTEADVQKGDIVTVEQFAEPSISFVDVIGTTKGKGFAGVMKRHGFGGMPASHGTERKHRSPGGIGTQGSRGHGRCVKKGKRMSGHMGDDRCTILSLRLMRIDKENDLLLIRGSIPGPNGSCVVVRQARKKG